MYFLLCYILLNNMFFGYGSNRMPELSSPWVNFDIYYSILKSDCPNGTVSFTGENSGCYVLLERGPCNESEWLVYQKSNGSGVLTTECVKYPCEPPDKYMAFDQQCHNLEMVNVLLCPPESGGFFYNFFGEGECKCPCFGDLCGSELDFIVKLKPCDGSKIFRYVQLHIRPIPFEETKSENCVPDNDGNCVKIAQPPKEDVLEE